MLTGLTLGDQCTTRARAVRTYLLQVSWLPSRKDSSTVSRILPEKYGWRWHTFAPPLIFGAVGLP